MSLKPEEYREEAARIRALAQTAGRSYVRATLLEIADVYDDLAGQVEHLLRQRTPKP